MGRLLLQKCGEIARAEIRRIKACVSMIPELTLPTLDQFGDDCRNPKKEQQLVMRGVRQVERREAVVMEPLT
jgi:hypothetical protein